MALSNAQLQQVLPAPLQARHAEYSMVFSADDEPSRATDTLIGLALEAAQAARYLSLADVSARLMHPPFYPDVWPGEHYRLLAALVQILQPRRIVEIGTGSGLSALTMLKVLPADGSILTFDVMPWQSVPGTALREPDFQDGRLTFYAENLGDSLAFPLYLDFLKDADFIFVDAAKDGVLEHRLLQNLASIPFSKLPIVMLDDIRLWNMLKVWREIDRPKLDVTSFGHWSGTGLVEWRAKRL